MLIPAEAQENIKNKSDYKNAGGREETTTSHGKGLEGPNHRSMWRIQHQEQGLGREDRPNSDVRRI